MRSGPFWLKRAADRLRTSRHASPRGPERPGPGRKIIYLGFHKCGTTSIWKYFSAHGLRVIHNTLQVCDTIELARDLPRGVDLAAQMDKTALDECVAHYDVLTDNPFPLLFEYFDRSLDRPLFILGVRPTELWIDSMQRYFGTRMPALGHSIYNSDGNPCSDPQAFRRTYEAHNATVRSYFADRNDFLEIRLGIDSNEAITEQLENFAGLSRNSRVSFGIHRPN